MSAWTPDEISAELARRSAEEGRRDTERADAARRLEASPSNSECLHCGNPFVSYGDDHVLCDTCLGND